MTSNRNTREWALVCVEKVLVIVGVSEEALKGYRPFKVLGSAFRIGLYLIERVNKVPKHPELTLIYSQHITRLFVET